MKNPIFSKLFLALWNGLLFVGGITMAACSFIIANHAVHELPEEIYSNVTAYVNVFGIVILVFGIIVAIFAFWGCVAFNCRLGWMMITYLVLLGVFSIAQLVYGILCMSYSKKDEFPIANGKIQDELSQGFEQYCHYNPVPQEGIPIYDAAMKEYAKNVKLNFFCGVSLFAPVKVALQATYQYERNVSMHLDNTESSSFL